MSSQAPSSAELLEAFRSYERLQRIQNTQVGCILVMTLMPAGIPMDFYVYPRYFPLFTLLRFCSAVVAGIIWALHYTPIGRRSSQLLAVVIPMVPVFFIAWMIAVTEGFVSPYYAGLNLVLLAVGSVLRWTFVEALVAVSLGLLTYVATGFIHGPPWATGPTVNNFFFLICMDVIVVVGTYFQHRQRYREFALRFELDRNKQMLEENNQKLRELDEVKSRFFANISHELRTPLTLLLAPLETLINRFTSSFDEDGRNLLVTMHSNGMRLLKLINDLLDLVRLESGRMVVKREPLDLGDFLKGLASAARQMADDKRIKLETSADPDLGLILADRDKLEKMVLNLQFNALKFTPAGGRIEIRAKKICSEVVLSVKDTGMGISQKNLPHVFDRFWQADDSARRKYQGVGIGLALVKELTEIQEGTVTVESEEGKGTTFTIRLPWLKAESPAPEAATVGPEEKVLPAPSGATEWLTNLYRRAELFPAMTAVQDTLRPADTVKNGKGFKVLVADDEPDMLRFLKSQLSTQYQVIEAVDGQQAIEKASQFLPDIILLDMMMPEKDGLQACKELRAKTHTQSIPIILLTARADEQTKLAALSAGASDFLPKPFSTTELHVRVKNLIDSYHYQRKLSKQNQVLEGTIEQLKDTETQLVQTEKLASLGRMSAGIIHEINNPLNFATTGLYTLRSKSKYIEPAQQQEYDEILKDVEEGITRVKTIVSDLRSFSHHENEQLDEVKLAEVVTSSLRFLSHEWKDTIEVVQQVPDDQIVLANKNKLIQVVVNLLQNSLDALKTKQFDSEKPCITIQGRLAEGRSLLVVRDNGEGIEQKNLDKIFDPFFTTKEIGQGMGLGLSICYRIIEQFDGRVSVRSEQGKFCEFTLDFPAKRPELQEANQLN